MAYFPNGESGRAYQARYCDRCLNLVDKDDGRGPGCAVWDAHLLFSYDAAGEDPESKGKRAVLNVLIPETDIFPDECGMFRDDGKGGGT